MLLSAKLKLDTSQFTGPLKESADATRSASDSLAAIDPSIKLDASKITGPLDAASTAARGVNGALSTIPTAIGIDTSNFTGPLKAAASSAQAVAGSMAAIDPARAARAADAFRRLSLDAASGRVQLSGTSNEMLGVADGASKVADGMGKAAEKAQLLGMQASQIRMLSAALGGMALNVGGAALEAYGHEQAAGYLKTMGSGALQGALIGGTTFGPKGAVAGMVIGAASSGAGKIFGDIQQEKEEAEALRKSLEAVRIDFESTGRAIGSMEKADQATATLKQIREEIEKLQSRMAVGLEIGDIPRAKLIDLQSLIGQVTTKQAELRESEAAKTRETTIGESRLALGQFDVSQSDAASRRGFDKEFQSAKTSADRVALVTARMDEFGAAAAKLRERLLLPETQADPEAFSAALGRMMAISNEFTRLQGLDTKVKDQPLRPSERASAIPSDSLARIGVFIGGAGNKMESIAERTARATASSERILRQIATKAGNGRLVWA